MQKNRLKKHYDLVVRYDSIIQLPLINAAEIPEFSHIILNKGLGNKAVVDRKQILSAMLAMELISGRRPYITEAKKSIDKLKLRQGMPIGCKVTLRGACAYLFLDRLMLRILPKITGGSAALDRAANTSEHQRTNSAAQRRSVAFGVKDLYVYDEILRLGEVDENLGGFDVVFVYRRRRYLDSSPSFQPGRKKNNERFAFGNKCTSRNGRTSFGQTHVFNE